VALGGVGGVVGAEFHPRVVRAVTWHVEVAANGFEWASNVMGVGFTHLGPVLCHDQARDGRRCRPSDRK
jgi:hypothetical protein